VAYEYNQYILERANNPYVCIRRFLHIRELAFSFRLSKAGYMDNATLSKQIQDLQTLIAKEEENYKDALSRRVDFNTLKEMRLHIRKMKEDLQVLLDKDSVNKTGELPKEI
jgi:hypothetical protein